MSSSLADCLFAFSLPQKIVLEVRGLPKLSICVLVLGRLPIRVVLPPKMLFRGAGLAEAEYVCLRPWQTAIWLYICPKNCFYSCWACLSCFLCHRPWQTAYLRFLCPPKLFLEVLGLPKLNICVNVLGRLPNCVLSAPILF